MGVTEVAHPFKWEAIRPTAEYVFNPMALVCISTEG
jgi:hypothetical protein